LNKGERKAQENAERRTFFLLSLFFTSKKQKNCKKSKKDGSLLLTTSFSMLYYSPTDEGEPIPVPPFPTATAYFLLSMD
jgi:hypothetical protein